MREKIIAKHLRKIILQYYLGISYTKNDKINPFYVSQHYWTHNTKHNYLKDVRQWKIALSCCNKTICIIKRNNIKTRW